MRARGAEGASAETDRGEREHTTASEVATDDTFATRLTGRAVRFGPSGDAGTDQPDDRRRQPTGERWDRKSRVARVADFASWAERVTATADDTEPQTKRARKRAGRTERRTTAAAVSGITTAGGRGEVPETAESALRGSAAPTTTGGGGVDFRAEEVGHARSKVSGYSASGAKGADTDVSDITTADGAVETQLPIPVTSRFGAPIPVTELSASSRSCKSALVSAVPCRQGTVFGRRRRSRSSRSPSTMMSAMTRRASGGG